MLFLTDMGLRKAGALLGHADSSVVVAASDAGIMAIAGVVRDDHVIILRRFTSDEDVRSAVRLIGVPTTRQ